MNVFFDDWKALGTAAEENDWSGKISEGLMLYQAFTDQKYTKDKKICCVNWHPTIYGKVKNYSGNFLTQKYVLSVLCEKLHYLDKITLVNVSLRNLPVQMRSILIPCVTKGAVLRRLWF